MLTCKQVEEVIVAVVSPLLITTVCPKYYIFISFGGTIFEVAVFPVLSNLTKYALAWGFWVMVCGMLLRTLWNQPKLLCNWDGKASERVCHDRRCTTDWTVGSCFTGNITHLIQDQMKPNPFFFLEIWQTRPSLNLLSIHYYVCSIYPVLETSLLVSVLHLVNFILYHDGEIWHTMELAALKRRLWGGNII